MRLKTFGSGKFLRFIYLLCLLTVIFDVVMLNIDGSWNSFIKLSPFAVGVMVFIIYRGLPQFIYDSDGEVLNFTAREPNLVSFGKRFNSHIEFPKRKLLKYSIVTWPFRRKLILYIDSKDGKSKKVSIVVSYLRRKELRDLKRSLETVIAKNLKK